MKVCRETAEEEIRECAEEEERRTSTCRNWHPLLSWICFAWNWVTNVVCVSWVVIKREVCLSWETVSAILFAMLLAGLLISLLGIGFLLGLILTAGLILASWLYTSFVISLIADVTKKKECDFRSTDQWRPSYHFFPDQGWMNDPCGLVFHKSTYHMFFQHIPINDESLITGVPETCNYFSFIHNTNRVHWTHVESNALIDWSSENIVLQPSSESSPFTGSAVIDNNEIFLIFTRHFGLPFLKQEQFSARFSNSNSPIDLTDEKLLLKKPFPFGITLTDPKFRDPKVLLFEPNNGDESFWVMTLATGTTISFYKAALSDLNSQNWEKLSEFPVYYFWNTPFVECAELLKVPHTNGTDFSFVLTASEGYVPGTQATSAWYVIGEFDGSVFSRNANENIIRAMDYGPDFYAHQSWFNTSRPTIIAWMNNWKYAQEIPTKPWKGQYTIPRHIAIETIDNELRLIQSPIDEIYRNDISQELSINQSTVSNFRLTPNISHQIFRNNSALNIPSCVIDVDIDVGSANRINFNVKSDPDTGQKTQIIWNRSSNEFTLDRSNSGTFIPPGESSFTAPANLTNNLLKIKILIDKSSVEVFLGRGEIVFSSLVFPDTENNELSLIIDNETDNTILRDLIIHEI